jgi:hypothetical protein
LKRKERKGFAHTKSTFSTPTKSTAVIGTLAAGGGGQLFRCMWNQGRIVERIIFWCFHRVWIRCRLLNLYTTELHLVVAASILNVRRIIPRAPASTKIDKSIYWIIGI